MRAFRLQKRLIDKERAIKTEAQLEEALGKLQAERYAYQLHKQRERKTMLYIVAAVLLVIVASYIEWYFSQGESQWLAWARSPSFAGIWLAQLLILFRLNYYNGKN